MRPSIVPSLRCPPRHLVRPMFRRAHSHSRFTHLQSTRLKSSPSVADSRSPRPSLLDLASRSFRFMSTDPKPPKRPDSFYDSIGMEWYDLSPERKIQWMLGRNLDAKWGWVIYRTTFRPDLNQHWESFKKLITEAIRADVTASGTPEIIDQMDFVFVENPSLDNAPVEALKQRFKAWAVADGANPSESGNAGSSRHAFFIQVDEESLLSLLTDPAAPTAPPTKAKLVGTHVNLVQAWMDGPEGGVDEYGDPHVPEDWTKMMATMISPYFYAEMDDTTETWYAHYRPPPHGISYW